MIYKIVWGIFYSACLFAWFYPQYSFSQSKPDMQKVTVNDRQPGDWLGFAAGISGEYAIASAPMRSVKKKRTTLKEVGVVYVFKKKNTNKWEEIARIEKPDPAEHDLFGYGISKGVAIYKRTIAIGGKGSIYLYEVKQNDQISFIQKIQLQPLNKEFGAQVALNDNFLIVNSSMSGRVVHIYKKINKKWLPFQVLSSGDNSEVLFGYQFALSERNTLVIGSGTFDNARAFCYKQSNVSGKFEVMQQFQFPNTQISSISVTDTHLAFAAGMILLYKNSEQNQWIPQQKIEMPTEDGLCLSLSDRFLLLGAFGEKLEGSEHTEVRYAGAAYLFENIGGIFAERRKYVPVNSVAWDKFGFSVYVAESSAIIGSRFETEDMDESNPLNQAGALYFINLRD